MGKYGFLKQITNCQHQGQAEQYRQRNKRIQYKHGNCYEYGIGNAKRQFKKQNSNLIPEVSGIRKNNGNQFANWIFIIKRYRQGLQMPENFLFQIHSQHDFRTPAITGEPKPCCRLNNQDNAIEKKKYPQSVKV
jgi:hypothetical protein